MGWARGIWRSKSQEDGYCFLALDAFLCNMRNASLRPLIGSPSASDDVGGIPGFVAVNLGLVGHAAEEWA